MVEHTQAVRRQQQANFLNVSVHFVGLALKEMNIPGALNMISLTVFLLKSVLRIFAYVPSLRNSF